jgi:hypothetical protein
MERAALPLLIQPRVTSSAMKQQQDGAGPSTSDTSRYDGAVRATLGKKLYAEVDECVAARSGLDNCARAQTGPALASEPAFRRPGAARCPV